ncbi:calcium/proton exchanger [Colletotrichum simmondsii]|uniref:Calcium/proton exchanger n=1 Tax=Colletotrichum simmondsii TaxID=703756 RepID=A0A135SRW6_9PEZI|nr:calcium/proton exchanger [Colletotrichum simmondsii]
MGFLQADVLRISQATSIALDVAFLLYVWYEANNQRSIFDEVIEIDEQRDADREADMEKPKFTLTESIIALLITLVLVTLLLIFLVRGIEHVVHSGVPDQFLGLILLPLVEKAAEHLAAIDVAWGEEQSSRRTIRNHTTSFHPYGSLQWAISHFGWMGSGKPMDLNSEIFMIALFVLSILVVKNFPRDGESNLLEGALLVVVYTIIAIAYWCYPSPDVATSNSMDAVNATISIEVLQELQQLLRQSHMLRIDVSSGLTNDSTCICE